MKYPNNVENPVPPPKILLEMYLLSAYSRGVLLLISAFFLADSMKRIRSAISDSDVTSQLNSEIFIAHLVVLTMYIVSTFLFYVAFTSGTINPTKE